MFISSSYPLSCSSWYPFAYPAVQNCVGQDCSVGVTTGYGLDGPGTEFQSGRDSPRPFRPALWSHPTSCTVGAGSLPGVKRPGSGVDHPPPFSTVVKERVELCLYFSGPPWPVVGWTLPFNFHRTTRYLIIVLHAFLFVFLPYNKFWLIFHFPDGFIFLLFFFKVFYRSMRFSSLLICFSFLVFFSSVHAPFLSLSRNEHLSAVAYLGGGWGGWWIQTPPKFRSFDKVEQDCKLSGKCLVFLFQHPN